MELFYNPDLMSEDEIKATFVARQGLVDELMSIIEHQPDGAGVQHMLIIAPRGMGKTTVLLMVRFAIEDRGLAERWQAVKFPEESYGIYDLADFWVEVLNLLAVATNDEPLGKRAEILKTEYADSDHLQEAALALIKDWRREHKKRIVLLVDNFDMILEQIGDERDNARLRDVLTNDGTIVLIGCAVSFFQEARAYDQPLYNFFKIYDLRTLRFDQVSDLLRRRAAIDQIQDFEDILKANKNRLRALEYFTGGNPRLVLMLYRVVTHSDIAQTRGGLEKLLDEVTPYYKGKIETLPPQQRKIVDYIARVTNSTREGVTPSDIAAATRLTPNQASAQLKRLSAAGYVRAANIRGRSSYYTLSEPLYALWHQMRFGRSARQRMQWLVDFLSAWYESEELGVESARLEKRFRECLSAGLVREARDALEHRHYLGEAMTDLTARSSVIDGVVRGYLDLKDSEILKGMLNEDVLKNVTPETLNALHEAGIIEGEIMIRAMAAVPSSDSEQQDAEGAAARGLAAAAIQSGRLDEVIERFDRILEVNEDNAQIWLGRAIALATLERYEEAISSFDRALKLNSRLYVAWHARGHAFIELGKHEEAIASLGCALEIDPKQAEPYLDRGSEFFELRKYEEALASFNGALEKRPDWDTAWLNRGNALFLLNRYEEALSSYDRALQINSELYEAWDYRGRLLHYSRRYDEALDSFDRLLRLKSDSEEGWCLRGHVLADMERYDEAIDSFDRALQIEASLEDAWHRRGHILGDLGRHEEALQSFENARRNNDDDAELWLDSGAELYDLRRYEEALASFEHAIDLKSDLDIAWLNRGNAFIQLGKFDEAISSYDRALKINPAMNDAANYRARTYLLKFSASAEQNRMDVAENAWNEALKSPKSVSQDSWRNELTIALLKVAQGGHLEFTRQLISRAELEESLFPLVRAIEYLLSNDEALIEKLTPEVRGVVDEIVTKVRETTGRTDPTRTSPAGRKSRTNSSGRKKKRLH